MPAQTLARFAAGERLGGPAGRRHERLAVVHARSHRASNSDGFQVLRAHHRPDTRATGGAVQVVNDAGVAIAILAGRADRGDAHERVIVMLFDRSFDVPDTLAPKVIRGHQGRVLIFEMQIHRAW